jgi:hypothetical protein
VAGVQKEGEHIPVRGIDGDVKLNRALWVMAEAMLSGFQS